MRVSVTDHAVGADGGASSKYALELYRALNGGLAEW